MNDPIVFKQSVARLLFKQTVVVALLFSLGTGISAISAGQFQLESWLILSLFTTTFYCCAMFWLYSLPLNSNPNFYTIEITDQQIVGPQSWRSITVPVNEVDVARSRRRGWFQALLGRRRLRSTEGKGLFWFDDFAYGKGQFDRLLEVINQLQTASTAQPQDAQ